MEKSPRLLNVGLVGLGRLGHIYANIIARELPNAQLYAVAGHVAKAQAELYGVPYAFHDRLELFAVEELDAIVICSSTDTHVQFIQEAFKTQKPVFCEKPLALSVAEVSPLLGTQNGTMFQMGFMRRFDPPYVEAKRLVDSGAIGMPFLFKSTSRDKEPTSLEYARHSGGMILDMGIHDLDLARWFMGEPKLIHTLAGRLVTDELTEIDDIDNAIINLTFPHALGVIDLSRNGTYGYDIQTEILGTNGAIRIGGLRHDTVTLMLDNHVSHTTVGSFMERFKIAFRAQLQNFLDNVQYGTPAPITLQDGIAALELAETAMESAREFDLERKLFSQ